MGLVDEFEGTEDFRSIVHSIQDPFKNNPNLEWRSHTSSINPMGSYEQDIEIASKSMLEVVTGDGIGGTEFYYDFKDVSGRIYLVTPEDPLITKGDVIAGNFGDPTYRDLDKAASDSILMELEGTYQNILNKYSTEYATPRGTEEIKEGSEEFGSVFSIKIPPDFDKEEIERTVEAVVDASSELNNLADQLIHSMQTYRND